jgi:hypothetical protein
MVLGPEPPHLEATSPDMTNTVNELIAGAKTDMEKIKAIFYYVSKNIRYMGLTPEKDRPGFEPHDVKYTFAKNTASAGTRPRCWCHCCGQQGCGLIQC